MQKTHTRLDKTNPQVYLAILDRAAETTASWRAEEYLLDETTFLACTHTIVPSYVGWILMMNELPHFMSHDEGGISVKFCVSPSLTRGYKLS